MRSDAVRRASASIGGVAGECNDHSAFLDDLRSGSSRRRGSATAVPEVGNADLFLSENIVPGVCAGFCAITVVVAIVVVSS